MNAIKDMFDGFLAELGLLSPGVERFRNRSMLFNCLFISEEYRYVAYKRLEKHMILYTQILTF